MEVKNITLSFLVFGSILAFLAGCILGLQAPVNAILRSTAGTARVSLTISFGLGTVVCLALALIFRDPWPSPRTMLAMSPYGWLGSLFGAAYLFISLWLFQRGYPIPLFTGFAVIGMISSPWGASTLHWFNMQRQRVERQDVLILMGATAMIFYVVLHVNRDKLPWSAKTVAAQPLQAEQTITSPSGD